MFIYLRVSCLNAYLRKISSSGGNHAESHLITLSILFNIARLNAWSQIHYWIGAHNTVLCLFRVREFHAFVHTAQQQYFIN